MINSYSRRRAAICASIGFLSAVLIANSVQAEIVYAITGSSPNDRIMLGNDLLEDLSTSPGYVTGTTIWGVAADYDDRHVYWTRTDGTAVDARLYRRDGSSGAITSVATGPFSSNYALAFHQTNSELYLGEGSNIFRLSANMSPLSTVVSSASNVIGIAFNEASNYLFYTDAGGATGTINRVDLATNTTLQLATSPNPRGVAYDPVSDAVFWIDRNDDDIYRINADGSGSVTSILDISNTFSSTNHALTIDDGRLYWAEASGAFRGVWSVDLDGSNLVHSFPTPAAGVFGLASIAAVPEPGSMLMVIIGACGFALRRQRRTLSR